MFQAIGIMCLSLSYMQQHCSGAYERFEGAMLRAADDALTAVMTGGIHPRDWHECTRSTLAPCPDVHFSSRMHALQDGMSTWWGLA